MKFRLRFLYSQYSTQIQIWVLAALLRITMFSASGWGNLFNPPSGFGHSWFENFMKLLVCSGLCIGVPFSLAAKFVEWHSSHSVLISTQITILVCFASILFNMQHPLMSLAFYLGLNLGCYFWYFDNTRARALPPHVMPESELLASLTPQQRHSLLLQCSDSKTLMHNLAVHVLADETMTAHEIMSVVNLTKPQ
jgi:hypothetical protein